MIHFHRHIPRQRRVVSNGNLNSTPVPRNENEAVLARFYDYNVCDGVQRFGADHSGLTSEEESPSRHRGAQTSNCLRPPSSNPVIN